MFADASLDHPKFGYKCFEIQGTSGQFATEQDCINSGCQGVSPTKTKQTNITAFDIDDTPFNSSKVDYILNQLGKNYKNDYANVINSFKDLGNKWGHSRGTTLSLNDVVVKRTKRDKALLEAAKKSGKNAAKISKNYLDAAKSLEAWDDLPDTNNFKQMIESGGHGNPSQIRQILYRP